MQTLQRAVRVVVLNERADVLLLQRARFDDAPCWVTPGCALLEGETFEDAAARFLRERLGLSALPRRAWASSSVSSAAGRLLFQEEQFYLAEVPHFTADAGALAEGAGGEILAVRWWSLQELEHPKGTLHLLPKDLTANIRLWQEEALDFEASELGLALGALNVVALRQGWD